MSAADALRVPRRASQLAAAVQPSGKRVDWARNRREFLRVNDATASKSIAAFVGPALVALGATTLINLGRLPSLVEQVAREPALIMVSGMLLFVAGLAIVRAHHHWSWDWSILVTLLGWLSLLGGLARILVPFQLADAMVGLGDQILVDVCAAILVLVVGVFLSYKGYAV